jgi:hypothetical protein
MVCRLQASFSRAIAALPTHRAGRASAVRSLILLWQRGRWNHASAANQIVGSLLIFDQRQHQAHSGAQIHGSRLII